MADSLRAKGRATRSCPVPLNTGTLCGLWVARKLNKALPPLSTAFSLGFHGDCRRCELSIWTCEFTLYFLLAQCFGGDRRKLEARTQRGLTASLISMKTGGAGEILKASMAFWKSPSHVSYQGSTDTQSNSGSTDLWLRMYKNTYTFLLADACPFVATTTTTTKFLRDDEEQKLNRFFIFQP